MATIRLRQDRWQVIVKRKGYPLQSKTFELRKDAEKWGRQQERLLDTGQWTDRRDADQTTLAELLDRYAREVTPTKRGEAAELHRLGQLKGYPMARKALSAINAQEVANWRDARLKQVSGPTVTRELQILSHVFSVAIREWGFGLNANPVSLVRKPSPSVPRDRVLTDGEREALLVACGRSRNPWLRPVVIFALETAARRNEILSLRWPDVDLAKGTARLNVTKTGQPRTVPLSPLCIAMLRELPRTLTGAVFPLTPVALRLAYERSVVRAGIEDFTFHDLRHDALTRLAKRGFSVLELRAISGHTTANMLQRYVSVDAGDLARKLAAA